MTAVPVESLVSSSTNLFRRQNASLFRLLVVVVTLAVLSIVRISQRSLLQLTTWNPVAASVSDEITTKSSGMPKKPDQKIIVVGMPKSGTTTIWNYFTCAGLRTQHYCAKSTDEHPPCPQGIMATCMLQHLAKNNPMLEGCGDFDVYCQLDGERKAYRNGVLLDDGSKTKIDTQRMFLPQHFNLQQLHEEYPNATWILPLRGQPKTWATSVLKWFRIRFFFFNEYVHKSKDDGSLVFPNSVEEQYDFLVKIYEEHTKLILDFVKEHPSHKLVQVNISDPDAGIVMEEAFGYSRECWGHANAFGNRTATDFAKTVIGDKT